MAEAAVYTVAELAAKLDISDETVRLAVRRGQIPARIIGDRTYILPRATIDRWLEMSEWQVASLLRELGTTDGQQISPEAVDTAIVGIERIRRVVDDLEERLRQTVGERQARLRIG